MSLVAARTHASFTSHNECFMCGLGGAAHTKLCDTPRLCRSYFLPVMRCVAVRGWLNFVGLCVHYITVTLAKVIKTHRVHETRKYLHT